MKTQFNFSKITLTVVLFFSFLFSKNVNAQLSLITDVSNYNGSNISCFGDADGWIRITPVNAIGDVTFTWAHGDSVDNIQNLEAGVYEVWVSDDVSTVYFTTNIVEPQPIHLTTTAPTTPFGYNLICNGDNKGRILASATGGTGKLLYEWSNGSLYPNQSNLPAGSYTLTVTDDNGCNISSTEVLTEPDPVRVTITKIQDASNATSNDGSAIASAVGGQGGYNFVWDNQETTQTAVQLSVGFHTMKAYDYYGCGVRGTVDIFDLGYTIQNPITLNPSTISSGSRTRGSNTILKPAILNNDFNNEGLVIKNIENYNDNTLVIVDMMGNIRAQYNNVSNVNTINVNLERGHYAAYLSYKNENGETETTVNQISIR